MFERYKLNIHIINHVGTKFLRLVFGFATEDYLKIHSMKSCTIRKLTLQEDIFRWNLNFDSDKFAKFKFCLLYF